MNSEDIRRIANRRQILTNARDAMVELAGLAGPLSLLLGAEGDSKGEKQWAETYNKALANRDYLNKALTGLGGGSGPLPGQPPLLPPADDGGGDDDDQPEVTPPPDDEGSAVEAPVVEQAAGETLAARSIEDLMPELGGILEGSGDE